MLGGLILQPDRVPVVLSTLDADDFYSPKCRAVFEGLRALHESRIPIDNAALNIKLKELGKFEHAGGISGITDMVLDAALPGQIEGYAEQIKDKSLLRQQIRAGQKIIDGVAEKENFTEAYAKAADEILQLGTKKRSRSPSRAADLVSDLRYKIGARLNNEAVPGVPTGIGALDEQLCGLNAPDFIIVAARPSMGKTALALNFAVNAATGRRGAGQHLPRNVVFFSLEMDKQAIMERLAVLLSQVDSQVVKRGKFVNGQDELIERAFEQIQRMPLDIFEQEIDNVWTVADIEGRCKALELIGRKPEIILIDYISYIKPVKENPRRPDLELRETAKALKLLAKRLGIPVVLLSQLNRSVESRQNKRPQLSDLRESGGLEEIADVVLFIYRDEYYNPTGANRADVELIIAKNRNGPTSRLKAVFQATTGEFHDHPAPYDFPEPEPEQKKRRTTKDGGIKPHFEREE